MRLACCVNLALPVNLLITFYSLKKIESHLTKLRFGLSIQSHHSVSDRVNGKVWTFSSTENVNSDRHYSSLGCIKLNINQEPVQRNLHNALSSELCFISVLASRRPIIVYASSSNLSKLDSETVVTLSCIEYLYLSSSIWQNPCSVLMDTVYHQHGHTSDSMQTAVCTLRGT